MEDLPFDNICHDGRHKCNELSMCRIFQFLSREQNLVDVAAYVVFFVEVINFKKGNRQVRTVKKNVNEKHRKKNIQSVNGFGDHERTDCYFVKGTPTISGNILRVPSILFLCETNGQSHKLTSTTSCAKCLRGRKFSEKDMTEMLGNKYKHAVM